MDDDQIANVDSQLVDQAGGFCEFCGHLIAPVADPPQPEDEPPF